MAEVTKISVSVPVSVTVKSGDGTEQVYPVVAVGSVDLPATPPVVPPPVSPPPPPPVNPPPPPPIEPPPVVPPPPPPIEPVDPVSTSDSRVVVDGLYITTPHDKIPIPQAGNILTIPAGQRVDWNLIDDTRYDAVLVYGWLKFARNVATRLRATTVIVFPGGTLDMGTEADPITARAEIIVNDVPLDTVNDPQQYGNGIIVLGTFTAYGLAKDSFLRLAVEPKAGDTTLTLAVNPKGWQAGDRLVLPDSRHLRESERWSKYVPQWERVTIASVSGNVVTLESPLQFGHPAAYNGDGVLEKMPHVGNLSRNIVIRSENASGTRGHCLYTRRAWVDLNSVQFSGLGRTKLGTIDVSNPRGRYPVHFHHLPGPLKAPEGRPQSSIRNCAVWCPVEPMPFKWGVVVHDSHFGEVTGNVLFNWAGAGIVGESGSETENLFERNFVCGIRGNTNPRNNDGQDGSAFWLKGFNNRLRNNVAASAHGSFQGIVAGSGFNLFVPAATKADTKIPKFRGADPDIDYVLVDRQMQPILEFAGNEAYGTATGFTVWHLGTDGYREKPGVLESFADRLTTWHCWEEGYFGYPTARLTFIDFLDIGHTRGLTTPGGGTGWTTGDYRTVGPKLIRPRITNRKSGISGSTNIFGEHLIDSADLQCSGTGIGVQTLATPGSGGTPGPRTVRIVSPKFRPMASYPAAKKIARVYPGDYVPPKFDGAFLCQSDAVLVQDMDRIVGDSFEVHLPQQAADFVVPQSSGTGSGAVHGAPGVGMTNAQNLEKYGVCISGKLLPAGAVDRAGVGGKVVAV